MRPQRFSKNLSFLFFRKRGPKITKQGAFQILNINTATDVVFAWLSVSRRFRTKTNNARKQNFAKTALPSHASPPGDHSAPTKKGCAVPLFGFRVLFQKRAFSPHASAPKPKALLGRAFPSRRSGLDQPSPIGTQSTERKRHAGDCRDGPKMAPRWPHDGPRTRGGHAHSRAKRFDDSIRRKGGSRHGPTRHALRADLRGEEMTRRPERPRGGWGAPDLVS